MNWAVCALVGATAAPVPDQAPLSAADAARAAAADVAKLDPATAYYTRYFTAHHLAPAERFEMYAVLSFHLNAISREGTIVRPRRVTSWLWAIDKRDYGWPDRVWGGLASAPGAAEPYFHVEPLGADGRPTRPLIPAPWLPAQEYAALATATASVAPIVRADWFVNRTAIQEGRDGFGYYDFLGLKVRKDAEALAGLDRAKAIEIYREQAGVIVESGVALQGRQLFRFSTIAGAWWESRDTKGDEGGRGARNAIRQLLDDYRHDAEEVVFTLPNRLPGFYLSDAQGSQIKSAPPDIASDHKSASNDKRVHVGMSCIRCHESGGLKPFDDHFRQLFKAGGNLALGSTDNAKYRRLKSVYLGPIERAFRADSEEFAAAIADACGLTPAGLSAAFARQWSRYIDEPVTRERAAAEIGLTPAEFTERLQAAAKRNPLVDPVLAGYLTEPPTAIRREQFEELYPLLHNTIGVPQ